MKSLSESCTCEKKIKFQTKFLKVLAVPTEFLEVLEVPTKVLEVPTEDLGEGY